MSITVEYETYREIVKELQQPIIEDGLDAETIKRLYESKLVYLENLRVKCFWDMNRSQRALFSPDDYALIYKALQETKSHLRDLVVGAVEHSLKTRRV